MGIFHSIKKSRRASSDLDEKIEYLNKELDKNGLREAMTTTGMYVATKDEPNSSHNAFKALSHDGQPLGFSGADYNIFTEPIDGLKYSPPHPVTGERRAAQSWFGIATGFSRVAANSDREILWVFDQSLSGGLGRYFSLELTGGDTPFWGTWISTAFGTEMLVPFDGDLSPLSDALKNSLNNLNINNFTDPSTFGPENNTIAFKNDLGDPDFLPIDAAKKFIAGALDLAGEGFEFLKTKASEAKKEIDARVDGVKGILDAIPPFLNFLVHQINENSPWTEENPFPVNLDDKQKEEMKNDIEKIFDDWGTDRVDEINNGSPMTNEEMSELNNTINAQKDDRGSDVLDAKYPSSRLTLNNIGNPKAFENNIKTNKDGSKTPTSINDNYVFEGDADASAPGAPKIIKTMIDNEKVQNAIKKSNLKYPYVKDNEIDYDAIIGGADTPSILNKNMPIKVDLTTRSTFKESYITEGVGLGHFDPEVLNVDINDIRKGIMPEFPKDPPPEMIDGYSAKSKLAPKVLKGDSFIKVTKKDLAQLHILKDSEIKELLQQIDLINAYLKNNPADLVYAQQRYPKNDIRLAKLNWKMDQMLGAGKEYMDKTFPENEKLFKKIQKSIKKNIELTDPKSFKDVEIPKFEGVNLIDFKRRKEVVSRHFKKAVKIERLFSNKKRRNSIREEREYLNNESENNTLKEFMSTTGMYFATRENPAIPAVTAPVPDSTGVLGSGFTPPIGGNGNANDPSNYPAAFDTAWMYNSNDVDGVTNRPIIKTMDQSVIDTYNAANPESSRFPAGGAGIVFGDRGFGTGVGYASGGHYIGVLSPGLFGNGSTKIVPGDAPFSAPWFGMGGMYFPATIELAGVIKSMSSTYLSLGGYNPSGARPIQLWAPWSRFHDGDWEDQGTQKYISNNGNRYVIRTFYMYATANDYVKEPAVPVTTTVLYRDDLGNPDYLPIKIDLGDISDRGFQYLEDKATASSGVNYDVYNKLWDDYGIEAANWYENNPNLPGSSNPHIPEGGILPLELAQSDGKFSASSLGAEPGDELASAPYDERLENDARSAYFQAGGLMAWSYLDPIQKDYWRNKVKSDASTNIPDTSDTETSEDPKTAWENVKDTGSKIASTIWTGAKILAGLGKGKKLLADFIADYTINPLVDKAFGFSVADSAGEYNKKLLTSLGVTTATGKNQEIKLSDKAKKDLINNIDIDKLKKHMTIGPTPTIDSNNAVNPGKGKQNGLIKGSWGNQGGTHINYDPDTGKFTVTMVKMLRDFGELDEKSAGGKITNFHDIPSPTPEQLRKQFSKVQLDKLFKFAGKYHPLRLGGFSGDDIAYGMTTQFEGFTKAAYNLAIQGTASNIVHFRNEALKLGVPKSEIEEMGAGFGGYVYSQVEYLGNDIPGGVTSGVRGVVTDRMKTHLGISESKNIALSEEAMLGHFEPEQLNVNIEDLRKGIMPEFPEEAPPELINGYSSKSRLAPKKLERSSFIKITKKDLAKNHMLKDSEIKMFMKRINAVNDFIKKHPEELVYAQTRYPKSDPRLAQLNWEMDQKLNASKQYMDKHYPENQRLFTKIQKSIKKNVELTDPKSFKGVKTPKFKGVDLTDYKRRKAVVSRHFKKAIRNNKK